ncbi:MAG: hypothetical protein M1816_006741 [Peltula sp. TS41687]|nr:MAG: hypothetical protein M1816_006741 [Peltula sp. TS41687]
MSASSDNRLPTAVGRGGTGTQSTPANSSDGAGLLSSMMGGGGGDSKNSSTDSSSTGAAAAASAAGSTNTNDQKPQPGPIGKMWESVTGGASAK